MQSFRLAALPDQTFEGLREFLHQASKLSRAFAVLVETLDRHRGKGAQKVVVEHVHVLCIDVQTSVGNCAFPFQVDDQGSEQANEQEARRELRVFLCEAMQALGES
jgi:hypothetical protein